MSPALRPPVEVSTAELERYLARHLGASARVLEIASLGNDGGEKQFGYGAPVRVRVETPAGKTRDLVVHRMKEGSGYGHDRLADHAADALLSFETFNHLPRHVAAVD